VITEDFVRCEEELDKLGNVNDMEKRKQEIGIQLKAGRARLISLNVSTFFEKYCHCFQS